MVNIFLAIGVSLGFVSVYYLLWIVAAVMVQKVFHYDRPNGAFYKIIGAPTALAELLFDLFVPESIRKQHFRGSKRNYLNRAGLCFVLNVVLYSVPAYLVLFGIF